MIRRNDVLQDGADQRAVKWCLIAAAFALSVGLMAEAARLRQDVAQDAAPVDTTAVTTRVTT